MEINIKDYVSAQKELIKEEVSKFDTKPLLAIVQVNENPASDAYIRGKIKDLVEVGMDYIYEKLSPNTTEEELLNFIDNLNNDPSITGIIVQLPLPDHIDEEKVKLKILPQKDCDGFSPLAIVDPATPKGILNFLKNNKFELSGKNAVILGRSNIVGKPMHMLLLKENMNVTILHSKTNEFDRNYYLSHADYIIVAVGKINTIKSDDNLKRDAVVIDVGINRVDGKLVGDCEKDLKVRYQTPVPGGVGLLTRLQLLNNLLELKKYGI